MYTLNLMSTFIFGFYNRNDKAKELLDEFADVFPMKDDIARQFQKAASLFNRMRFSKGSMWLNKANSFSLFNLLAKHIGAAEEVGFKIIKERLVAFEANLPRVYELSAKEAVNNRRERDIRDRWLLHVVLGYDPPNDLA